MTVALDSILWTPVKGTVAHRADELRLTAVGLPDDRLFHFIEADGRQSNTSAGMLVIRSEWDPDTRRLALILPNGESAAVVVAPVPDGQVDPDCPYDIVDGPLADLASDHLGRPVRIARSRRSIGAVDIEPLTILSLASIAAVERILGQALGAERFRMSFNLAGAHPYQEDEWYGRRLALGPAILRVVGPVGRCAVTTYEPRTGRRDASTVKALIRHRPPIAATTADEPVRAPLGVYARVERAGTVRCGDEVVVLDDVMP